MYMSLNIYTKESMAGVNSLKCMLFFCLDKILIGTTRGGGHMRGGKQRSPFPQKNENIFCISLRTQRTKHVKSEKE